MSIKEDEQKLFNKWQNNRGYKYFVRDGVFDENEWHNKGNRKILFVLKEANWQNENIDLCKELLSEKSSTYWKTWNNIARWTKALLEGCDYPYKMSKHDKTYWLKKIAFLNLKKIGGGASSNDKVIREHAVNDREYILEQINLYSPDIIICCGRGEGKNADILHDIVFPEETVSNWQEPVRIYNYFYYNYDNKRIPVISFYHPQIISGHDRLRKLYEDMCLIGKELLYV